VRRDEKEYRHEDGDRREGAESLAREPLSSKI
jgi:hypothetical protein